MRSGTSPPADSRYDAARTDGEGRPRSVLAESATPVSGPTAAADVAHDEFWFAGCQGVAQAPNKSEPQTTISPTRPGRRLLPPTSIEEVLYNRRPPMVLYGFFGETADTRLRYPPEGAVSRVAFPFDHLAAACRFAGTVLGRRAKTEKPPLFNRRQTLAKPIFLPNSQNPPNPDFSPRLVGARFIGPGAFPIGRTSSAQSTRSRPPNGRESTSWTSTWK